MAKTVYMRLFLTIVLASSCLADWKSDANIRIEQNRKRNALISVVDHNGHPVVGLGVQIEQTKHRFAFGTCIRNNYMSNSNYKNFILNHFEWAVCENETKWPSNEPSRDYETYTGADNIYNWCNTNGIKMRGHCLFWEQLSNVQSWVQSLNYATYPASSDLLGEVDERITSAVTKYKNKFKNWDVDNEIVPMGSDYRFYDRLGDAGRVHMFQKAHDTDPNCKFIMNEYSGNSFGYFNSSDYVSRASSLIASGAPIDGLGIQAHLGNISTFNAQNYYTNVLQPLAAFNRPIWATEFDVNQLNDTIRANIMEDFYRICFSHSSVEGIMMWGFRQGITWQSDWYMTNTSYVPNQTGLRYEALLDEWTTNASASTDYNGAAAFRGFHGTYDITLSSPDKPDEIYVIEVVPGTTTAEFTIVTNLPAPAPDLNAPLPNPPTWASVPADVNSSAIIMTATTALDATGPVYYYFECTNHNEANSAWQTSPTYIAKGLTPSTSYSFRIKARDSALAQNTTGWSSVKSATTAPPDTVPPSPNPLTWAAVPTAIGASSIVMKAVTATDNEFMPVQYQFECLTDANKSSGWQLNATYLAIGLNAGTQYTFRARARDSAATPNITNWSTEKSATPAESGLIVEPISLWTQGTNNPKVSGADRALIFVAHAESSTLLNLASVTYGGYPMTKIIDKNYSTGTGFAYTAAFVLKEASILAVPNGSFVPAWDYEPDSAGYSSVFLSHVDQTVPIGASDSNGTAGATVVTGSLAASNGDMFIEAATCGQSGSYTLNNSFSQGIDQQIDAAASGVTGYKPAVGVSETPSATFNGTVNGQSLIGFVVKAGTGDINPAAPANLTATAGLDYAVLNWNDNTEPDLAGYNIFISTTQGSGYSRLNNDLLQSSNYTQYSLLNGTTYYFVVTAVDIVGNESAFSNEVSVRPGYQTCQEVINNGYVIYSDLNGDCYVNFEDFSILARYWMNTNCYDLNYCDYSDMDGSGTIDFVDLFYFCDVWMQCNNPPDANCSPNW